MISSILRNSYESHYTYKTETYRSIYTERVKLLEKLINPNKHKYQYGILTAKIT